MDGIFRTLSHEAMVIQEEQDAIYGYTVSYHNINEPLRGLHITGARQVRN